MAASGPLHHGGSGRTTSAPTGRTEDSVAGQPSPSVHQKGGQQGVRRSGHHPLPPKLGVATDGVALAGFFGLQWALSPLRDNEDSGDQIGRRSCLSTTRWLADTALGRYL